MLSLHLGMTWPLKYSFILSSTLCYSAGFLPTYLLPAYEEVVDHPVRPPPPYTPLQTVSPQADPHGTPCSHTAASFPSDGNIVLTATPEATQSHLHSIYNPNKDVTPSRYRRFTGDSGIEVCDGQELWDQHGFLDREEESEHLRSPCDHCSVETLEHNHSNYAVIHENTNELTALDREPKSFR